MAAKKKTEIVVRHKNTGSTLLIVLGLIFLFLLVLPFPPVLAAVSAATDIPEENLLRVRKNYLKIIAAVLIIVLGAMTLGLGWAAGIVIAAGVAWLGSFLFTGSGTPVNMKDGG